MATLILISCTGGKMEGGNNLQDHSVINYLDNVNGQTLIELRHALIPIGGIVNPQLLMPAHHRYTGNLFGHVVNWDNLNGQDEYHLLIVSALYGLLRYNESIPVYNLWMNDKNNLNKVSCIFCKSKYNKKHIKKHEKTCGVSPKHWKAIDNYYAIKI